MKNSLKLITSIVICEVAGIIGSFFTMPGVRDWYYTQNKPSFSPPNWLFAPVWTTLFVLMGVALYLVWKKGARQEKNADALAAFFIQLFFNILWSVAFFGLRNPFLGLLNIVLLWVLIILTIIRFYKVSKPAAWLLVPYLAWVSFATILNFAIVLLN